MDSHDISNGNRYMLDLIKIWTGKRDLFFCGLFMLFLSCFLLFFRERLFIDALWSLVVTCWERADLLANVCDV